MTALASPTRNDVLGVQDVAIRLADAHATLALMPEQDRPHGHRLAFGGYGAVEHRRDERLPVLRPTCRDITLMAEALGWLEHLRHQPERVRRAVLLRSMVRSDTGRPLHDWRSLGQQLGCAAETARQAYQRGLDIIVTELRRVCSMPRLGAVQV